MMVINMDIDPRAPGNNSKGADSGRLTHINQNQAGDFVKIDVTGTFEAEDILNAAQKELTQAALLATWKHHHSIGIKPLGSDHRTKTIKIGVDVGGDDFHGSVPDSCKLKAVSKTTEGIRR